MRNARPLPLLLALTVLVAPARLTPARESPESIEVAMLTYSAQNKSSVCFSDTFLKLLAHEADLEIRPRFAAVGLESPELFEFPFVVMSGEGPFELTDEEVRNLRRYLTQGGFLLASAGCSNPAWNLAMERTLSGVFPQATPVLIPLDHPVFSTVFAIRSLESKRAGSRPGLYGIEIDGRLAMVYSPEGLNDTANAAAGCCCCGGSEIRNARYVNANVLAYALTH